MDVYSNSRTMPYSEQKSDSESDSDSYSESDSESDLDSSQNSELLYRAMINILDHVSQGIALGEEYQTLIQDYHNNYGVVNCQCANLSTEEADLYHLKFLCTVFKSYYGQDFEFIFDQSVPTLDEIPSNEQLTAMFADENIVYFVQYRLVQEGIIDQLP